MVTLNKGTRHALRRFDGRERGVRRLDRDALESVRVVPHDLHGRARRGLSDGVTNTFLGIGEPGSRVAAPLLKVDDDRER